MGDLPMRPPPARRNLVVMVGRRFLVAGILGAAAGLSGCSVDPDEPSSGGPHSVGVIVMAQIIDDIVNAFPQTARKDVGTDTFDVRNANGGQSLIASISP
jgi:hypothetical protein